MKVLTVILMLHHDKQSLVDVPVSLPGLGSIQCWDVRGSDNEQCA